MHGTYETIDDRPALRFERRLNHPVEKVWRAVTDPEELAHWFPAQVTVDAMSVGGGMTFTFTDEDLPPGSGEITELDPPRVFAFDWDGFEKGIDHLRFELEPGADDDGCLLRFTHFISESKRAARDAAGWHVCLDRLEESLGSASTDAPTSEPTGEWRGLYEEYERRGLPTGAEIPSA
jgi:uncharacterized protein YndB with AHSA1/START domain